MRIGEYQSLKISRATDHGLYLTDSASEVLLPKKECPDRWKAGETLRIFLLTDSEDRPVATTKRPSITVGEFGFLSVVSVTNSGAFLDWGLDKDLFCPFREQQAPMREGLRYLVRAYLDTETGRPACTTKIAKFLSPPSEGLRPGSKVKVLVSGVTPELVSVIVDD